MEAKNEIANILQKIPNLPENDKSYVVESTECNEWEVAFDYLCCKIQDNEIEISNEVYNLIEEFGRKLGLNENERFYWSPLKYYIGNN
ncbi:MAG: MafI family immunity protein [Planctomycetota bacterium]|jgi:hypothetical protein